MDAVNSNADDFVEVDLDSEVAKPKSAKKVAPGFSRNMKIIGAFLGFSILAVGVIAYRSTQSLAAAKNQVPPVSVDAVSGVQIGGVTATKNVTQPELDRLNRVTTTQSEAAKASGNTFIPNNMPLVPAPEIPVTSVNGPGRGYNVQSGQNNGGQGQTSPRDQLRAQGLQVQMGSILRQLEAPPVSSAAAYQSKLKEPQSQAQASARVAAPSTTDSATANAAAGETLLKGLGIYGAVLTSPLDTEKTGYVSARVVSGPATGALLFGQGQVVGSEGVRITFNRMAFNDLSYTINAVALDTQTSSDAMNAEIDRKVFSRYVIPIFGAVGKAYMEAVARPDQQLVVDGGTVNVVTPGASAKEAAAAGLGAGIDKVAQAATYTGPNTAYMPANSAIGVLVLDPVRKGSGK